MSYVVLLMFHTYIREYFCDIFGEPNVKQVTREDGWALSEDDDNDNGPYALQ